MKRYYKIENNVNIFWNGKSIIIGDQRIINPTDEQLREAGWIEYVPPVYKETIEDARNQMIDNIIIYDSSESVNSFSIDGYDMWLSKNDRVSMMYLIEQLESAGEETVPLWTFGNNPRCFNLPISLAKSLLSSLEIYAKKCYDITQTHKVNVNKLETIEEVKSYDYTSGYPEKPVFSIG